MDPLVFLRALGFAAEKHRHQRRKDTEQSPYLNHVIDVALILAAECREVDQDMLVAAILHDTVEDTETSLADIEARFGARVASIVSEVTDDKSLPKDVRKELQVEHARHASDAAKRLKIADKISNIRDIVYSPPASWSSERRRAYMDWAERVVEGCRGVEPRLEARFDRELAEGRLSVD